jgi:hypothetical protein
VPGTIENAECGDSAHRRNKNSTSAMGLVRHLSMPQTPFIAALRKARVI